jgi:hypothetical protein
VCVGHRADLPKEMNFTTNTSEESEMSTTD